jgi:hypothetical protein
MAPLTCKLWSVCPPNHASNHKPDPLKIPYYLMDILPITANRRSRRRRLFRCRRVYIDDRLDQIGRAGASDPAFGCDPEGSHVFAGDFNGFELVREQTLPAWQRCRTPAPQYHYHAFEHPCMSDSVLFGLSFGGPNATLHGNVRALAAPSQGNSAICAACARSANGFVVPRNRPNASNDGTACR